MQRSTQKKNIGSSAFAPLPFIKAFNFFNFTSSELARKIEGPGGVDFFVVGGGPEQKNICLTGVF